MKKEDKLIKDMLDSVQAERQKAINKIPIDAEVDAEIFSQQQNSIYRRIFEQELKTEK